MVIMITKKMLNTVRWQKFNLLITLKINTVKDYENRTF
jgi:hypothetical protein